MITATIPPATHGLTSTALAAVPQAETAELGDAIAELAARIHAATYELLVLLHQFDVCAGWNGGFQSCAHWLHWRTGIDLGAAREKVRVARALAALPQVSAAMRRGQLSYAKVRALTRVATRDNEAVLMAAALSATSAQVERLVRAWRRVDRITAARETAQRHQQRQLHTWVDDDGMLVIRGRLTPEVGAVVQRALDAAADRLWLESARTPPPEDVIDEVTSAQRRADALGLLAESALAANLDPGTAGDRYQVVLHAEADTLRAGSGPETAQGQAALEGTGQYVSAETSQRISCDASVVVMRHGPGDSVLDVGRKTRTIPSAIRRALTARDRRCRFPGCEARHCDAHHVRHWAAGGATRLDNLVLLCRRHHRAVHEEGWTVALDAAGAVEFRRPDGRRLPEAPAPPRWIGEAPALVPTEARLARAGIMIDARTTPVWDGTALDLVRAIDVLRGHECWGTDRSDCERAARVRASVQVEVPTAVAVHRLPKGACRPRFAHRECAPYGS